MGKVDYIRLTHFSNENLEVLKFFELPSEQEQFTSLPSKILEVTDGQFRIVILSKTTPVGFFILHATERVQKYSENQMRCC